MDGNAKALQQSALSRDSSQRALSKMEQNLGGLARYNENRLLNQRNKS